MARMTFPERSEPAFDAAERPMLEGWLDYHRETMAMKCAGLTDAQLREASVPPSAFTLLGLLRHMAEVERGWFREVLAGEELPELYSTEEDPDGEFRVTEADTWAEADAAWRAEIAAPGRTPPRIAWTTSPRASDRRARRSVCAGSICT